MSKILERAIHDQLFSYLNVNKLLANCQSGFRPSYSTATCLTEVSDYLFDKMDKRYFGGNFLDLRKTIGCIRTIKHLLSFKIFQNLYFGMILPYIDYCSTSRGSCAKIHRDKIQKLQNKYASMILNDGYNYTPQRSLLLKLNVQSVGERIKYQYCVLVLKYKIN